MFKLTDTMVLALLKKGVAYEVKDCKMEMEIPASMITYDEDHKTDMIKITGEVKEARFTIERD